MHSIFPGPQALVQTVLINGKFLSLFILPREQVSPKHSRRWKFAEAQRNVASNLYCGLR